MSESKGGDCLKKYTRTDLACEKNGDDGVRIFDKRERRIGPFLIESAELEKASEDGEGEEIGSYVTFHCGRVTLLGESAEEMLVALLAGEIRGMCERACGGRSVPSLSIFVAGLGNASLTADAIGPRTVAAMTVTRHLCEHEAELFDSLGCNSICALAPGVLGQTGIETVEVLRGAVSGVKPDVIIAIDALAARSCERLATTIQITSMGISPGSGVGNERKAINESTMGVPVISIGVPTVVNSATLVYDALRNAGIEEVDPAVLNVLEQGMSFFVSPKDSDLIVERISKLLARALNRAFVGRILD